MPNTLGQRSRQWIYAIFAALLATRLVAMFLIPLTDTTEARYAEIARKMVETGNWVTLWHDYGVPFWAKPPLSTWVSAISMTLFGINEFAARLPNLLIMIGAIAMIGVWVARKWGRDAGLVSALFMSSMLLIDVAAGTVMTDIVLMFCTTWTLIAFWEVKQTGSKLWGYLLFASCGVGLLAKGPVAIVLPGIPIFFWALWERQLWASIKCLPWVGGILLMLAIALPWYLLAEHRTPGFLDYFIVGENIKRFLVKGWDGDKYGHAHAVAIGTIVIYWLEGAFPWSLVALGWLLRRRWRGLREHFGFANPQNSLMRYLLLATIAPLVFFFFCRNIIITYPIVGLSPMAALMAAIWARSDVAGKSAGRHNLFFSTALLSAVLVVIATGYFGSLSKHDLPQFSQKPVMALFDSLRSPDSQLRYFNKRYYSAEFYSRGAARYTEKKADLQALLHNDSRDFIVVPDGDINMVPADVLDHFVQRGDFTDVILLQEKAAPTAAAAQQGALK